METTSNTQKIYEYYYPKIFELFKSNFEKSLNANDLKDYDQIEQETLSSIDLTDYFPSPIAALKLWHNNITHLKYLDPFIEDTRIDEIIVHDQQSIQIDKNDQLQFKKIENINSEDYQLSLEVLAYNYRQKWNFKTPFCSFDIKIKSHTFRATMLHTSIENKQFSKLFLRRQRNHTFKINQFNISSEIEEILLNKIKNKENIIITGSTSSGKTTFMNCLIEKIPSHEHLVIMEDTLELYRSKGALTKLLANHEIAGRDLKTFCAYALRLRPDRILLGEIRSNEIVPFILSMNAGHKGLISSLHANSAYDGISRMTLLFSLYSENSSIKYETIQDLICQNVDAIIHLENREVTQIININGCEKNKAIVEWVYPIEDCKGSTIRPL